MITKVVLVFEDSTKVELLGCDPQQIRVGEEIHIGKRHYRVNNILHMIEPMRHTIGLARIKATIIELRELKEENP